MTAPTRISGRTSDALAEWARRYFDGRTPGVWEDDEGGEEK